MTDEVSVCVAHEEGADCFDHVWAIRKKTVAAKVKQFRYIGHITF